jgi:hypothetical protein
MAAGVVILALNKVGTGICKVCGRLQFDKKFKKSDVRDNAALNFVVCDRCKRSVHIVNGVKIGRASNKKNRYSPRKVRQVG